jgi:hypothetical protein
MSAERAPIKVLLRGEQSGGRGLGDRERLAARLRRATSSPPRLRRDLLPHRGRADLPTRRRAVHEEGRGAGLRPAGGAHTYANFSDASTRHLIAYTPAGFERYFGRKAAERRDEEPPEWALQPIPESIVVGPRIGERRDGGQ